ncbi:hypothetical protein KRX57_02995 [Weeksellaceae bacterium TAE3-ERU29]|nr:hypothetical protein [Weeksellaceae bacterium TAE3-ERU29]
MYNEDNFHSDKLGVTLNDHCTICHFSVLTPLDNEPISVPKPFLEFYEKNSTPFFLELSTTSVIAIDRLRGPPVNS